MDAELVQLIKQGATYAFFLWIAYSGFFVFFKNAWAVKHFKGPMAVPMLGNLYDPKAVQLIAYLAQCRKRYGKVFRFFTFNRPYIVLLDKIAAREALIDSKTFHKGPDYPNKFGYYFGLGLVTSGNEKHAKDKKIFAKYFTQQSINQHLDMLCSITSTQMEEDFKGHQGGVFDMDDFFKVLAWRMFSNFCLHKEWDKETSHYLSKVTSTGSNVIGESIVLGYNLNIMKYFSKRMKYATKGMNFFKDKCEIEIQKREAEMKNGTAVDDPLTAMIEAKLPRKEMYEHLITLCAAGHDTTAYACAYMCYLLAKHPEIQLKLKKEVKSVLGNRTKITEEDIEKLTYSRNVFQETLRIYSVIPHCTRIATKDVKLEKSGLFIPKGQEILVPFCLLSRDTDEWGQNITSFEPDRFEGMNRNIASKGYLPFGYGSRACIGGNLAMTEGTIILALLVQKWKFSEDKDFNMKINSGISMVSENGVKVILEPEDRWDTIETLNVVTSEGA